MPPPSKTSVLDGISVVTQGMNSGVAPRLVQPQQLAFAINITNRGGIPRTRPVWRKVALNYFDNDTRLNAEEALFQGASFYQSVGQGQNCLIASIGGRIFRYLVGSSNGVSDLSLASDLNDPSNPNAWMWQAEDFLIIQNGQSNPLFFDGAGLRRSLGEAGQELPPGCMGCYVQGRVWTVLPTTSQTPSQAFLAGDAVYSHGYDGPYGGRDAVLKTTELSLFSGGAIFSVPMSAGPITGMAVSAIPDTSLGQGPLQVMTQGSVFSINVPFDRALWFTANYPLAVLGLPNYGTTSQTGVAAVNGDLWYRALDGIRSYQIARRDFNTWVNTPLSVEVESILNQDTDKLLDKCSCVLFNNRLLTTVSPFSVLDRGTAHRGLVALDFNNISNLTSRSNPTYDGLWTGLNILQLVKGYFDGVERCFAFCLDCAGRIVLYELLQDGAAYFDWDGENWIGVESSFETRAMGYPDLGNRLKRLQCADLYLDRLAGPGDGTIDVNFKFRTDEDPTYKQWHSFELCAKIADCSTSTGCVVLAPLTQQYRTYIRLPDPPDVCSEVTKRMDRTGYEIQVRMWTKGYFQLNRLHVWSDYLSDSIIRGCPTSETCVLQRGCDEPWFTYSVEGCSDQPAIEGIVEEDTSIWITTEGNVILREEDQDQTGDGGEFPPDVVETTGACQIGGACFITTEANCEEAGGTYQGDATICGTPPFTPPVWPSPTPYTCTGLAYSLPINVTDPVTSESLPVGISPGAMDPNTYVSSYGPPGCLESWSAVVWADFIASGTPFTQARLVWQWVHTTGYGFMGIQAFPDQVIPSPVGGYGKVVDLDVKIVVEYCPP